MNSAGLASVDMSHSAALQVSHVVDSPACTDISEAFYRKCKGILHEEKERKEVIKLTTADIRYVEERFVSMKGPNYLLLEKKDISRYHGDNGPHVTITYMNSVCVCVCD